MTSTPDASPTGGLRETTDLTALDAKLRLCGWTDADLARAAGLSKRTIANLRKDPDAVSEGTWRKIAQAILAREREDPEFVATMGAIRPQGGDA